MIGHFINGEERASRGGETFETINPWSQQAEDTVAHGREADVADAVAAARKAFDEGPWPQLSFEERGALLHRLADLIEANLEELARADSRDMGKPLAAAKKKDVPRSAQNFRFFADHARMSAAERFPMGAGHHAYTRYEPAGVVASIAPWNFPLMLETWKVAPALAWGNTVVLKPAEDTPTSATLLGKLTAEAGFPPGVFNVVQGYGAESAGAFLTASPHIDRITFTGESATGRRIGAVAAKRLLPVSFELGGKGANVVFADADLDNAVAWSNKAIFTNAGQVCLAGSRLYVERPIFEEFLERFVASADALVVGDPMNADTQIGPLASQAHFEKVASFLDAPAGELRTGGVVDGRWQVRPTVIAHAPEDARICREEVFGPVVTISAFDGEDEVVAKANASPYGLNAMLFTKNLSRAHRVSARLRAGTVWVNCFFVRDLRAPFGGVGDSGLGREGGQYSKEFFTEPKAVVMQL